MVRKGVLSCGRRLVRGTLGEAAYGREASDLAFSARPLRKGPAMTAAFVENSHAPGARAWDYLLQTWRELDVPEGWRAEIDEGQIVLVPPPHAHHNGIAARVQRRLYTTLPNDLEIYQTLGIHVAPLGKLYVPDLVVMPTELIAAAAPETSDPLDAAEALLVVEITSGATRGRTGPRSTAPTPARAFRCTC